MKADSCLVTIRNWEKFNPKVNQYAQSHAWLRLSNNIPFSNDLEGLTHEQKWIFVTLLCEASKRMKGTFEVSLRYLARAADASIEGVVGTLTLLGERNIVSIKERGNAQAGASKPPPPAPPEQQVIEISGPNLDHARGTDGANDASICPPPATLHNVRNDTNVTNTTNERKKPIRAPATPKLPPTPSPTQRVIARYCDLWKDRWKASAPIGGTAAGQFKTLVKDHGEEKAMQYVEAYLKMNLSWFITKRHDIGVLLTNLPVVAHFLETGNQITNTEIKQIETRSHTQKLLDQVDMGKL